MTIRYSHSSASGASISGIGLRQRAMKTILTVLWRTANASTRKFLGKRLFSPRIDTIQASQSLILETWERFQVQVNGKTIQCWKLGQGPAILFVHGWAGRERPIGV